MSTKEFAAFCIGVIGGALLLLILLAGLANDAKLTHQVGWEQTVCINVERTIQEGNATNKDKSTYCVKGSEIAKWQIAEWERIHRLGKQEK